MLSWRRKGEENAQEKLRRRVGEEENGEGMFFFSRASFCPIARAWFNSKRFRQHTTAQAGHP